MNSADLIYTVQTFMVKDTKYLITSKVDDSGSFLRMYFGRCEAVTKLSH